VILRLRDQGLSTPEIAIRVGKKPGTIGRIIEMVAFKEDLESNRSRRDDTLRPLERVVRRLRAAGEGYGEIGNRLGRSGAQIRRIETYAQLKAH
jgi:DNA-binding CsgD family transcriptional regulator